MKLWRQLRWRIVITHMTVVLVGVTMLTLTVELIISHISPADIQPNLMALAGSDDPAVIKAAKAELVESFRGAILRSLLVAAGGAALAGLVASFLLAQGILRPLHQLARSSQRIASGHYDERIPVPTSGELAQVANHFNQMAESLAEIEAERIALIGNVAHELRTPLTGLAGYLEGVMDGVIPDKTETFAHMYQEVRRMRRLVDDLQALSRVEAGQIALNVERFDLLPLLNRLIRQVKPQAEVQCIRVELVAAGDAAEDYLGVYADRDRTAQILLNLLSNAIRYTPEGGCILARAGRADENNIYVEVEDDGLGIPVEALPYIFERFYRVDPSRARASGGSGIGLTIARHLAWAMGGELTASSPGRGQGSVFRLTLPAT